MGWDNILKLKSEIIISIGKGQVFLSESTVSFVDEVIAFKLTPTEENSSIETLNNSVNNVRQKIAEIIIEARSDLKL